MLSKENAQCYVLLSFKLGHHEVRSDHSCERYLYNNHLNTITK